jgi:D-amino peptidase
VPREVLLVVDLEGVAGVDTVPALTWGTPDYERARALLTAEVNAATEGLLAAGFTRVRVSDSHLSGASEPNVLPAALHPAASLHVLDDWYAASLFRGVAAVACLGMHAPADTTGFAAHTVDLSSRWSIGGRLVSESDLVLGLAAERGVPVVFVSGDDVLQRHLGPRVPFVRTKRSRSRLRATSRPVQRVLVELRRAAQRPPVPAPRLSAAPLRLDFHLARGRGGPASVSLSGTTRARYAQARRVAAKADAVMIDTVYPSPGSAWMLEDVQALISLPWGSTPRADLDALAARCLRGFLCATRAPNDELRALRALTLHVLEGLAPRFFGRHALAPALADALEACADVSMELEAVDDADLLQARIDALYLRRLRGLPHPGPVPSALQGALRRLVEAGDGLHAWLLGALAARAGVDERLGFPQRPFRGVSRVHDLYWLTHLVLLDTDYLSRPLSHPDAATWLAALVAGAPWVLAHRERDLAAELVFSLAAAGEAHVGVVDALLELLRSGISAGGALRDGPRGATSAHGTAAALLAFAGIAEARRQPATPLWQKTRKVPPGR